MPSKKKKYNSRFPPARIKKIMQTDDEIGKVAAAVPVLISKCLEMFLVSILNHTGEVTKTRHAKTMSTSHLKECISTIGMFDFLKDVVANVAEMQNDDEPGTSATTSSEGAAQKTTRKRNTTQAKTPKKRVKLGADRHRAITEDIEATESDNDSFGESSQESSNGLLSSSMSSHGHPSPNHKTTDEGSSSLAPKSDEKVSFHIPLSTLMSIEKSDPAPPSEESLSITKTLPASDESDEGVAGGSGVIDMSMKSAPSAPVPPQARCPVIVTNSAVVSMSKSLDSDTTRKTTTNGENRFPGAPPYRPHAPQIPAPTNMAHIYRPQATVPPEKAPGEPGIPQGGMLSFLYSPFSGETPPPPFFSPHQQPPAAHPSAGSHFAQSPKAGPPQYPYNPMSAQLRRDPYPHPPEMARPGPTKNDGVTNDEDDDDYDA